MNTHHGVFVLPRTFEHQDSDTTLQVAVPIEGNPGLFEPIHAGNGHNARHFAHRSVLWQVKPASQLLAIGQRHPSRDHFVIGVLGKL